MMAGVIVEYNSDAGKEKTAGRRADKKRRGTVGRSAGATGIGACRYW